MGKLSCSKTDMYRGPSTSGVCQRNRKTRCVRTFLMIGTSRKPEDLFCRITIFGNLVQYSASLLPILAYQAV